ncbi:MAG TPA: protein TolQ [Bdellovibrionota bacterium]|jgi:biopolymer transport protein TolQ|nr:protein TolQ [Bdellovibrionota bacterium]
MAHDQVVHTGVVDLVLQTGLVVQMVLLTLVGASVVCWAVILTKYRGLKASARENARFLDVFWKSKNLEEISRRLDEFPKSPVAAVFQSGYKELRKLSQSERTGSGDAEVDNIQRSLLRASTAQVEKMEKNVSWLATTASAAPFVGLFGTVWGIMNSFQNIGAMGSANLAVVAPGIAEALIATATGLGAAIPAVVGYNHFAGSIRRITVEMDCFSQDFLNIIQRSLMASRKKAN